MDIFITSLSEGAKKAKGLTVVIDVFRAFSTICYAFGNGAKEVIPIKESVDAFELKKHDPALVLMGEENGLKIGGFDFGNSPTEIENVDFSGKTIIMRTSAGIQGILYAKNASELITGSFVNAGAIVNYIKKKNPKLVTLVPMGNDGTKKVDEDESCAEYIKNSLLGNETDFLKIKNHLRNYKTALKFFNSTNPEAPEKDFELCLNLNKFNFVLKVKKEGVYPKIEKVFAE